MPASRRVAVRVGGVAWLPLDGRPSPRPAIPGGVVSRRAGVRFTGHVDDGRVLSRGQVVGRVARAPGLGAGSGAPTRACDETRSRALWACDLHSSTTRTAISASRHRALAAPSSQHIAAESTRVTEKPPTKRVATARTSTNCGHAMLTRR